MAHEIKIAHVKTIVRQINKHLCSRQPLGRILPKLCSQGKVTYEAIAKAITSIEALQDTDKGHLFKELAPDSISEIIRYFDDSDKLIVLKYLEQSKCDDVLLRFSVSKRTQLELALVEQKLASWNSVWNNSLSVPTKDIMRFMCWHKELVHVGREENWNPLSDVAWTDYYEERNGSSMWGVSRPKTGFTIYTQKCNICGKEFVLTVNSIEHRDSEYALDIKSERGLLLFAFLSFVICFSLLFFLVRDDNLFGIEIGSNVWGWFFAACAIGAFFGFFGAIFTAVNLIWRIEPKDYKTSISSYDDIHAVRIVDTIQNNSDNKELGD